MNLIGVSGRAGSGKDTAAGFLVKNHGWVSVAFADVMKRICASVYPFMTRENLWGPSAKRNEPIRAYPRKHGPWANRRCVCCNVEVGYEGGVSCYLTARFALQQLGSEWGRSCYENTWVDFTLGVVKELSQPPHYEQEAHSDVYPTYTSWGGIAWFPAYVIQGPVEVKGVIIPDVRWPGGNEGQAIVAAGGKLMKMLRGEGLSGAPGQHQSEKNMDVPDSTFHFLIDNRKYELHQLEAHMTEVAGHPSFVPR